MDTTVIDQIDHKKRYKDYYSDCIDTELINLTKQLIKQTLYFLYVS